MMRRWWLVLRWNEVVAGPLWLIELVWRHTRNVGWVVILQHYQD